MDYQLKKSLGQHFLHDEKVCQQIVALVDTTQPNDDARFLQCAWSDYGVDGLSVCVNVHLVGNNSRRNSTTSQ